jgi:hypothetical protein
MAIQFPSSISSREILALLLLSEPKESFAAIASPSAAITDLILKFLDLTLTDDVVTSTAVPSLPLLLPAAQHTP